MLRAVSSHITSALVSLEVLRQGLPDYLDGGYLEVNGKPVRREDTARSFRVKVAHIQSELRQCATLLRTQRAPATAFKELDDSVLVLGELYRDMRSYILTGVISRAGQRSTKTSRLDVYESLNGHINGMRTRLEHAQHILGM